MLETILLKLNATSFKDFLIKEKEILEQYKGLEIERISPLSKLTCEEIDFLENYYIEHKSEFVGLV